MSEYIATYSLRMTEEIRSKLETAAAENGRSMNKEINAILVAHFSGTHIDTVARVSKLEKAISHLITKVYPSASSEMHEMLGIKA